MYNCSYCGKTYLSIKGKISHERLCAENPDRKDSPFKKLGEECKLGLRKPWNKGLSKQTDARILEKAVRVSDRYKLGELVNHQKGKPRTAAEKQKISETMKANPKAGGLRKSSGRGKKGWYKGFFCDSTYELVYVIYNLDNNIDFAPCRRVYQYIGLDNKVHKYYPDFELPDGSLVEIKGYHTTTVDLKTASVTDRPLKVLYEKDLVYAFDWVKQHYNYSVLSDLYE